MARRSPKPAPTGVRESHGRYLVPTVPVASPERRPHDVPRRALFDVNVLIALLDTDHVHHARASAWVGQHMAAGWASCAITQNGCVRIMSQPGYPNALATAQVASRLREATRTPHHRFVPENISLLDDDKFDAERLLGARQVTDAYLLGLAVEHGLRLVTFDASLGARIVRGAEPESLVCL